MRDVADDPSAAAPTTITTGEPFRVGGVIPNSLPELLAAAAQRWPEQMALTGWDPTLTYGDLVRCVEVLARRLRDAGVPTAGRVGLCVSRGPLSLIASAAIMRLGGAYVPLQPGQSAPRLQHIATSAGLEWVVCDACGRDEVVDLDLRTIELSCADLANLQRKDFSSALPLPDRSDPAYVLYTSGSTGVPKGVEITHGNVIALFEGALERFEIGLDEAWPMTHGDGFDVSVWERWAAIATGSTLICLPEQALTDAEMLAQLLISNRATRLHIVPSIFAQLVDTVEELEWEIPLRNVTFCGEAIRYPDMERWARLHSRHSPQWFNVYGITETTIYNTLAEVSDEVIAHGQAATPIGQPFFHSPVLVMDDAGGRCATGAVGEIYIGGAQTSVGYVGDPALTAKRFVEVPGQPGPWYRTGDLGYLDESGNLNYVGRADDQVKVRGMRVELGEIDHALRRLSWVSEAATVAQRNVVGDNVLTAGLVLTDASDADDLDALLRRLRLDLRKFLPAPLVPTRIFSVDRMPLNANGKTDRRALAELMTH